MPSHFPDSLRGHLDRKQRRTRIRHPAPVYSTTDTHDLLCGHRITSDDSECRQNCLHPTERQKQRPPFYCLSCIEDIIRSHLKDVVEKFKIQQAQIGKDISKLSPGFVDMLIDTEVKHASSYMLKHTDMEVCEVVEKCGRGCQGSREERGRSTDRRTGSRLMRDRSLSPIVESESEESEEEEVETQEPRRYRRDRSPHRQNRVYCAPAVQNSRKVEADIDDLADHFGDSLGFRESALIDALVGLLEVVNMEDAE
ncbi:hypothetical protein BU16DRAFT_564391 [Lophium mytilinum]|uniref:Uncharacterized protein n=1 Tax=Lophium mytilinum TaxID=390894 RepID=A0A6A6QIV7_9PEZI|nr:hypothetical protein BU16DRAFT_564391 [Lophium mytilinum]